MAKNATPTDIRNRPTLRRGETRQKLMDAGLAHFSSLGFEGVTVMQLEEAVGLKAGTGGFYRHFADKRELLEAIIEREIEEAKLRRAAELASLNDTETNIRDALRQQFKLSLLGLKQNQEVLKIFGIAQTQFPDLFHVMRKELIDVALMQIIERYTERIAESQMVYIDPVLLAMVIQSALFGFGQASILYGENAGEKMEDAFIETLLDLVIPKKLLNH